MERIVAFDDPAKVQEAEETMDELSVATLKLFTDTRRQLIGQVKANAMGDGDQLKNPRLSTDHYIFGRSCDLCTLRFLCSCAIISATFATDY